MGLRYNCTHFPLPLCEHSSAPELSSESQCSNELKRKGASYLKDEVGQVNWYILMTGLQRKCNSMLTSLHLCIYSCVGFQWVVDVSTTGSILPEGIPIHILLQTSFVDTHVTSQSVEYKTWVKHV